MFYIKFSFIQQHTWDLKFNFPYTAHYSAARENVAWGPNINKKSKK